MVPEYRSCLVDLFDKLGRLRPFDELAPDIQAQIKKFEIRRRRMRRDGETTVTEELIRVVLRDGRTAKLTERGGGYASGKTVAIEPTVRRIVTTTERSVGAGRTEAAAAIDVDEQ
jgi:hypothetical protein